VSEPDNQGPIIECLTITSLWRFGRYIYTVMGFRPYIPIPWVAVVYVVGIAAPIWLGSALFGIPYVNAGLTLRFAVPLFLVWACLHTVAHGERPRDVLWSWARTAWHVHKGHDQVRRPVRVQARPVTRLQPTRVHVRSRTYVRDGR
jgi:hypothetical protein